MYMTPNGRIILSDEEKKKARMVMGTNVCIDNCKDCQCGKDNDCKKEKEGGE
jgi:hypothetical protein